MRFNGTEKKILAACLLALAFFAGVAVGRATAPDVEITVLKQ